MHITSLSTALVLVASTLVAGRLNVTEPKENAEFRVNDKTNIVWDTNVGGKVFIVLAGGENQDHLEQCGVLAG